MIKLSKEKVLSLHRMLIETYGGIPGVRDLDLLSASLESIYQTFDGIELYPTIEEKGARLGYNIVRNHAFFDGNKRIGLLTMLSFLSINGVPLECSDKELIEIGLILAEGKISYEQFVKWVIHHITNKKSAHFEVDRILDAE